MKFVTQLNLIIEGIGASRNIDRLMPTIQIYKDKKFLRMTDYLYGLKKLIQYINEEIEDHNKKAKVDISKLEIKLPDNENREVKKEITKNILEFIDNKLDRDLFKKQLIRILISLFKDQNQYSDFYAFCEDNIRQVTVLVRTMDNKYNSYIKFGNFYRVDDNPHYQFIIHDMLQHLFLNPKDVQKFGMEDKYEYDAIVSDRYSPRSILNELIALQYVKDYNSLTNDFIELIKKDFKNFVEKSKIDNSNIEEQDFINKKFNKIFNLKNEVLIEKLRNILLNDKDEDFNFDEIKTISILLKNSTYKEYFKLTSQHIPTIMSDIQRTIVPSYEFMERIIMSIRYRKNKLSKNKNEPITWKDFRTYFRDYPYLLKLVPESKYPDNKIIFDDINRKNKDVSMADGIKKLEKINNIFIKAVSIGQVLTKKSRTGTFDIENKEDKIDFVIERFSKLLKNQFNDNSKYYALIDKELK